MTEKDLRKNLRENVYVDAYLKKQGITDPEIPEETIKSFYEGNPDNYRYKETVIASHILIQVDEKATAADKKKARKKAEKIRKKIIGGKDFAETAIESSDCNSAAGGGRLKPLERGYMPEAFDKAAFALEPGKISEVVETKFGFHIIQVSEKFPAGIRSYEDARDFIKKFFQMEESKKKLDAHRAMLKQKAKIEILLNES